MNNVTTITHDPVCGMNVRDEAAAIAWEYNGARYLFCAEGCKQEFLQTPEKYAVATARPRRTTLARELVIAAVLFAAALVVVLVMRGLQSSRKQSAVYTLRVAVTHTIASSPERAST